jgi:hypothetical protein
MTPLITTSDAISDPNLLGPAFAGPSWDTWRTVLAAAEGLPLTPCQLVQFRAVAERDPPPSRVKELWLIIGRRAGKDSIASAIATAAAMGDYRAHLRPGEIAAILCLAIDRQQAKIVLRYVQAYFRENPLLASLVARDTDDGLKLTNGVEIIIATNSFRGIRGRTVVVAILDECSYWRDESSANPDTEVFSALAPSLITVPTSMLIGITTAYRRSGLVFEKWRRHYGRDDPDVLVIRAPSRAFNPLIPQSVIDQAIERDPEAGAADWLSEWRSDLADFVDRAVVEAAVVPGQHELPRLHNFNYIAFVDPSGGSADSFTLAIAHRDDATGSGVLDCLREVRPPFSPEGVAAEFAATIRDYGLASVTGDRYGGEWPREQFQKAGVHYKPSERTKSDLYRELLPLLNSRKVELLDHQRLIAQLCSLERRTARGGRDSVDHPPGAHDDVANAAAGALVLAASNDPLAVWRGMFPEYFPQPGSPAPKPELAEDAKPFTGHPFYHGRRF